MTEPRDVHGLSVSSSSADRLPVAIQRRRGARRRSSRWRLVPKHASWSVVFATNEVVIAHKDHSRFTDQITAANWPEILTRPEVRLGRGNPDTAPIGYNTLLLWQLAEQSGELGAAGADLDQRLLARCAPEHVTHDEAELLALVESRAVDYAFLFRPSQRTRRTSRSPPTSSPSCSGPRGSARSRAGASGRSRPPPATAAQDSRRS